MVGDTICATNMAGGKCCEVKWYKWVVMGNKGDSVLDRVTKEGL